MTTYGDMKGPTACAADTETQIGGANISMLPGGMYRIKKIRVCFYQGVIDKATTGKLELKIDKVSGPFKFPVVALSMRQAAFQQMGVTRKLEKHVDQALAGDIMNNSGIGGILDLLGMQDTKKILANNPKTLGLILSRVAPLLSQFQQSARPGATSNFGWNPK